MTTPRDHKVAITDHAREQARARFPGFKAARIMDEVREALAAGRCSPDKPAGLTNPRPRRDGLYAWNETGERIYALVATADAFLVTTTMRVGSD